MNATPVKVTNEQVNDVPLLVGILEQMGIRRHIDACVEQHGNWEGISIGTLVEIWLCYILTEQDHRMVAVREWAIDRRVMFNTLLGIDLRDTDLSDDRLAVALSKLGYEAFQQQADESMVADWVSVYALPTHTIRLDSTSVSMYSQIEYAGSLLQRGHSKDHRPDLLQFKVMMSTLDPLGMPLRCEVISGEQADDGLYVPSYDQTVRVLGRADVLVVGDSKMAALGTRGHIVAGGSCYLCAYRPTGTNTVLEDWVSEALAHQAEWEQVTEVDETTGEVQSVVVIYAGQRPQEWTNPATEQSTAWQERVLVVRSESMREKLLQHSQDRLTRLEDDLAALRRPIGRGRKRYQTQAELQAVVDRLLDKYQCKAFMSVSLVEDLLADGSTRWIVGTWILDNAAWAAYEALLGWQLYLTNTTTAQFENTALLWSYRHQIFHERTFSRLKTRRLNIRPVYLRDERRIMGLTWLLALALRVLTLTEFRLRAALEQHQESVTGLNPAVPTQATARPTSERVFQTFRNLTFTAIDFGTSVQCFMTDLSPTQRRILTLLSLPADLYARLASLSP